MNMEKYETDKRIIEIIDKLKDGQRLDWLNKNGRVSKFSDGWNAWDVQKPNETSISNDIRKAIDEAMKNNP